MHGDVINHCVPAGSKKKEKREKNGIAILIRVLKRFQQEPRVHENAIRRNKAVRHWDLALYRFAIISPTCTLMNGAP